MRAQLGDVRRTEAEKTKSEQGTLLSGQLISRRGVVRRLGYLAKLTDAVLTLILVLIFIVIYVLILDVAGISVVAVFRTLVLI